MNELFPIIRKLIVIGLWVYVGYVIVPSAKISGRSPFLWYFAGVASLFLPIVLIYAIGSAIVLPARHSLDLSPEVVGVLLMCFWALGGFAGFTCLSRLSSYLRRNPKNA